MRIPVDCRHRERGVAGSWRDADLITRLNMERVLYQQLPQQTAKLVNIQAQQPKAADAFVRAFLKRSLPQKSEEAIDDLLTRKAVVLEHFQKRRRRERKTRGKGLSAKQRREMRLFEIQPEHQRYEMFLPLHELWEQYIRDLCNGLKPETQPQIIQTKLLKADLHGALVTVTKSKCPSYVGITGIVVQETKHVFKIITKEDQLKVVPKFNNVFSMEIDGFVSYIFGSKIQFRASERSAKKFKARGTIDL
ncbi:ribonuclease P protein subunit p29 [Sphaerodactylus townsendi]|uniref:RNase P/RNase MRP complex subunit n=1 Tax=Sphaerodactylus townsendi TaxID=933632 RepID=A0ACB8EAC4_9SAUR|nr:ribonuclease P protein subunit p29 [Sphaerodactylus townsendi]